MPTFRLPPPRFPSTSTSSTSTKRSKRTRTISTSLPHGDAFSRTVWTSRSWTCKGTSGKIGYACCGLCCWALWRWHVCGMWHVACGMHVMLWHAIPCCLIYRRIQSIQAKIDHNDPTDPEEHDIIIAVRAVYRYQTLQYTLSDLPVTSN